MKQEAASHKLEKEEQKEASKAKEEVEKAQGEVEPTKKDTGKNEGTDDGYEKFCFICRRPESVAGKMIELPKQYQCVQRLYAKEL